jgi:hypothetical protein
VLSRTWRILILSAGSPMPELIRLTLDESAQSSDGLLLHGYGGAQPVTAFISRRLWTIGSIPDVL